MSKIQTDEVSSIIKERIHNFDLNPDREKGITIISYNIPGVSASCLREAINQLNTVFVSASISCNSIAKSINDLVTIHENVYPILKDKEHEKHGWYRKFEKKRF